MIEAAQELINVMSNFDESLTDFNDTLVELFKVLPRKMKNVKDNLAQSVNDMPDVYQREQDLLDVMKGQVVEKQVQEKPRKKAKKKKETILEAMGIEMAEITSEEEQEIKEALGDISDRYFQAWKVINIKTQKQFDDYMDTVDNKTTKLLFHGSRSENWWSIINSGLILRPNAVITGKLYGYGIYFAPKARKSLGYTSIDGSYWAHGGKDSGFMGLYQVHYGNPYVVGNFDSQYYEYNYNKLRQNGAFDCLHAKAGVSLGYSNLKNDEIVIYQECQCTIKYLVELK